MKKLLTALMAFALIFTMTIPVLATESAQMTISASQSSAYPGETIDFTVTVSRVDDCRSGGMVISYDQAVFEYVSGKCLVGGATMSDFSGGTGVFAFSEGAGISGSIFQFTLKVRSDAPIGSAWVTGSPSLRTGAGQVSCGVTGAGISVSCDHAFGGWSNTGSSHQRICSKCGGTESVAHAWDAGTVTKAATCMEEGAKTVTCTVCCAASAETIAKTNNHAWGGSTKADGSSHKYTCTVCGKEEVSGHTWNEGKITVDATCKDSGVMTYTCTACGAAATESIPKSTVHTYNHDCDAECNICGASREITHAYDTAWSQDETGHWHNCTVCGESDGLTVHDFENDCATLCPTCGYIRDAAHVYPPDWLTDENGHWQACQLCGALSETEAHIPGEEATEDTAQVCTLCAYELVPALGHSFAETWSRDEENHWHECACDAQEDIAAHTWDEGKKNDDRSTTYTCSVCGAQRTEKPQGLSPAVWTVLIVSLLAVLGGGAALVIRRKKR